MNCRAAAHVVSLVAGLMLLTFGASSAGARQRAAGLDPIGDFTLHAQLNTGGTVSERGLLIGAEMYIEHTGVPHIVAHELVHYQQRPITAEQRTLLAQSIMEGSADFVAELISGRHINSRAHEYARPREQELWQEFSQVMAGRDFTGWLYGNPPEGRPADLGYFFGYRIAQAYFEKTAGKPQALRDILGITDYAAFLKESGYGGGS
jgi:uncharacterized protein YjaZ